MKLEQQAELVLPHNLSCQVVVRAAWQAPKQVLKVHGISVCHTAHTLLRDSDCVIHTTPFNLAPSEVVSRS